MFYRLLVTLNASYEPGQRHFIALCGESLCLLTFTDVRAASLDVVRSLRWFAPRGLESNSVYCICKNRDRCESFNSLKSSHPDVLLWFLQVWICLESSLSSQDFYSDQCLFKTITILVSNCVHIFVWRFYSQRNSYNLLKVLKRTSKEARFQQSHATNVLIYVHRHHGDVVILLWKSACGRQTRFYPGASNPAAVARPFSVSSRHRRFPSVPECDAQNLPYTKPSWRKTFLTRASRETALRLRLGTLGSV